MLCYTDSNVQTFCTASGIGPGFILISVPAWNGFQKYFQSTHLQIRVVIVLLT